MNTIRMVVGLLAIAVVTSCNDRSTPTALRDHPWPVFDAAAPQTSVITDSIGDAHWNLNSSSGAAKKVPGYLDVAKVEVARQDRAFGFTMNVADIVPPNPTEASGGAEAAQVWIWGLDTDPTTFPKGGPLANGDVNPFEFFVDVEWDGAQFSGLLYDRRPLLTGGAMMLTPVQFTIDGARLTVSVATGVLGNPSTFGWLSGTLIRHSAGTEGFQKVDAAPEAGLATWPQ